jgi:hypothetical protein
MVFSPQRLVAVVALTALGLVAPALGDERECHNINTTGEGYLTSLTATGGTTVGVIHSGLLRGTTQFSAQFTDAQGNYVGTLVITTKHGTLTLRDVGHLNFATGEFSDQETVLSGTGRFAGATGNLAFQGIVNLQSGRFVDNSITGEICLVEKEDDRGP